MTAVSTVSAGYRCGATSCNVGQTVPAVGTSRLIGGVSLAILSISCGGSGIGPSAIPIFIHPSVVNVAPGGAMTFFMTGANGYGPPTWSAASGSIHSPGYGACSIIGYTPGDIVYPSVPTFGACLSQGDYTAPLSGTDTVTVRLGSQSATTLVTVSSANWLGQPIAIPPSGGRFASNATVAVSDVPYVSASPGAGVFGCVTSDGVTCLGSSAAGYTGDGDGLINVVIPLPTVAAPVPITKIFVFMTAAGSSCVTPGCALYSETLNANFTITP